MTDKLQLMLINVLLDQFLNTRVSHGSVATHLRCDRMFYDQFITQSRLSPKVTKMKIGQHLPKLWAIKYQVGFFYETRCIYSGKQYIATLLYTPETNLPHCYASTP